MDKIISQKFKLGIRMKFILALFLFIFSAESFAITINKINFKGMVHISESVALRIIDFEVGDNVSREVIDESIKKYFKQGYFNDIWVVIKNNELTFHFKEKPNISKVKLIGWKEDDKDIVENIIQIKKGALYSKQKLKKAKNRILAALSQEGYIDSRVEIEEETLENGGIGIDFIVNKGKTIVIEKISYHKLKGLDSSSLEEVTKNKEHDFAGWMPWRNNGDISLIDLKYDPLRIRDLYMQHGYLDARVDEPFVKVDFNSYTANISYQIVEGDAYKIDKISIYQQVNVIDEKIIKEKITLKEDEIFNINTFRENAQKIKTIIADKGYAFVQVIPDIKKNEKDGLVEIIFKIIPGELVKIENVIISGNLRTLDRIIRRELYLGPGDIYSLTDLKDSRNSLGRLGYFDSSTIEEKRIDNQTIDLIIKVKEAPTGNIQLGGGYGSFGGFLFNVGVSDRNIWGSGINVGIDLEKSERTSKSSFSISNPKLNDSDFSGNFSIYNTSTEYDLYTADASGVSIGSGHKFSRNISGYLGYNYSSNTYDDIDLSDISIDSYNFENYNKSSVSVSIKFDNTDDYYLARSGYSFSQSFEKSGLGSTANFFKVKSKFYKYYGLKEYLGFDAIFRYKAKYNLIVDNGNIPIAEKFYMGGIGSVRGYQAYSLSPIITYDNNGVSTTRRVGAKQTFSNSIELSLPLVPKAKMRLVTYYDHGFIGDNSLSEIVRGGYGFGIEWFSPVGPIQLMFSKPVGQKDGDNLSGFEFTLGQRF